MALGVAVGMLTAAGVAAVGGGGWSTTAALVFAMTVAWVAADPRAVAAEVAAGTVACTVVLIGADGTMVAVVPLVTGVVAAAELAAAAGRVGMVVRRDPVPELRRVGVAAGGRRRDSGATLAASALPGPDGLAATVIGGAGLALAALAIRRGGRQPVTHRWFVPP